MEIRSPLAVAAIIGAVGLAASTARAQSQTEVFTQQNDEPGGLTNYGKSSTSPGVAVNDLAVVVTGDRVTALYPKTANPPVVLPLTDSGSPFARFGSIFFSTRLYDPRAVYDPINNRLWMSYLEGRGAESIVCNDFVKLHLAVSKDPNDFPAGMDLETLDDDGWWRYTSSAGMGMDAIDYGSTAFKDYKGELAVHKPLGFNPRLPSIGIDERALIFAANEPSGGCDGPDVPPTGIWRQHYLIVPFDHLDDMGNPASILDGDRPDEEDMTALNVQYWPSPDPTRVRDFSEFACAAQEPFPNADEFDDEQVANATLFVNAPNRLESEITKTIRLRGLFYDDAAAAGEEWTLQQQIDPSDPSDLLDMPILDKDLWFNDPVQSLFFSSILPRTPDGGLDPWNPNAVGYIFHSAVLVKDNEGSHRVFATHAVRPVLTSENGTEVTGVTQQWVVQWYVIDPDLADFHDTPAPASDWQPQIVAAGRIENLGDSYHPVIIVNRQGQAFIEYTYSDDTTWPEIRRVRLNSNYDGIVGSEVPVRYGPALAYDPDATQPGNWADYADAQADPFNACAYWSTHTLVDDPGGTLPTKIEARDIWLFHQAYSNSTGPNCLQSPAMLDLNDDNEVDAYDMAAFAPLYERRARRVDLDGSGTVDAIDMALYFDAFDAYTRGRQSPLQLDAGHGMLPSAMLYWASRHAAYDRGALSV